MWDTSRYHEICDCFAELIFLDDDQRNLQLELLKSKDPELARAVSRMLDAEKDAVENSFLDKSVFDSAPTGSFDSRDAKTDNESDPMKIGKHKIINRLGSGGMGVVYRAYDPETDREVAIKLIRNGALSDSEHIERFRREAKAAAQMEHPNIVRVYEVGHEYGCDYFTMALIEGKTLQQHLNDKVPNQRQIAKLFVKLARAVEYAHHHGIVHRDIKPANIIVDDKGEPQLTDFGLAKRTTVDESQTRTGQILGTVRYMAPEQISDAKNADFRTDVYGLGSTLFHCLTGVPPFSGSEMLQVFEKIKNRLPISPRLIVPEIDLDLESICMKCLQKDKRDRYQNVKEFATDLERYLADEPLVKSKSAWRQSISRVLKHRETPSDLPSARAAWWMSIITAVVHLWIFFTFWPKLQSHLLLWSALAFGVVGLGCVNYVFHWSRFWHLSVVERQSGIIQLATQISFLCLFLIYGPLTTEDDLSQFLSVYPPYCLVVGVALIAHVGFSGKVLVYGSIFFPLSLIAHFFPVVGPLAFAIVGACVCVASYREIRAAIEKHEHQEASI